MKVTFVMTLEIPPEATVKEVQDYISDAVRLWGSGSGYPGRDDIIPWDYVKVSVAGKS